MRSFVNTLKYPYEHHRNSASPKEVLGFLLFQDKSIFMLIIKFVQSSTQLGSEKHFLIHHISTLVDQTPHFSEF